MEPSDSHQDAHTGVPRRLAREVVADMSWRNLAACRGMDPDLWFPGAAIDGRGRKPHGAEVAIKICKTCPVAAECLAFKYATRSRVGIWGGMWPPLRKGSVR